MTRIATALMALAFIPFLQTSTPVGEFSPELMLKPKTTARFLLPANQEAGASYEKIADTAGLNVVFYRGFKPETPAPLRIENATLVEALDQLSSQTGNFWFPWSAKTFVVAPDNPAVRLAIEPMVSKTIYLDNDWTRDNVNAITNRLRDRYQMRRVFQNEDARALSAYDTANRIAAAEKEIELVSNAAAPRRASSALFYPEGRTDYVSISENGRIRRLVPSNRTHLQNTLVDSITIDATETAQDIYENLTARAGLNVIFDNRLKSIPPARFHLDKVSLLDALDLLALQSGTIWEPVSDSTIFVMEDSQQNRRDMEPVVARILYFTSRDSGGALRNPEQATNRRNGVMNVLRTAIGLRGVFQANNANALVVKDTPLRVFLAEKFLTDLDSGSPRRAAVTLKTQTSSFLAENGWVLRTAAEARPTLDLKLRGNTNIAQNGPPRGTFEALAGLGGLKVEFDPGVVNEPSAPLKLSGVDILDALDLLSLQTHNFWQVVDEHTIHVYPNTRAAREQREPRETRTFTSADSSEAGAAEMLNFIRVVFSLRDAKIEDKTKIVVRDTPNNLALVQATIDILGEPAGQ